MFFNPPEYIQHGEINRLKAELAEAKKQIAQREQDPNDVEYGITVVAWSKYEAVKKHLAKEQATNKRLREALKELLADTQHADHECEPDPMYPCPVKAAREALAIPVSDDALFEFGMKVAEEVQFSERHHEAIVREVIGE